MTDGRNRQAIGRSRVALFLVILAVYACAVALILFGASALCIEPAWASSFATALAVGVALLGTFETNRRAADETRLKKGSEAIVEIALHESSFNRLRRAHLPNNLPVNTTFRAEHAKAIDEFKLAWSRAGNAAGTWKNSFFAGEFLSKLVSLEESAEHVRDAMAEVVAALRSGTQANYDKAVADLDEIVETHIADRKTCEDSIRRLFGPR
ncbi:hypothetical protein GCM10009551_066400 [Nocardiopsis tropica]|uniref:hypothetical protein n=1 Tax=Tsukamurella strandjordii TaxID=147577 RepID=UPI0031DCEA03